MTTRVSNECLTIVELQKLTDGECTPVEIARCEFHVSQCERCRMLLESSANDQVWQEQLLPALHHPVDEAESLPRRDSAHQAALNLLGPTDDPHMLGRIGSYEVVALVGIGGMGIVFKAFDATLNRFVAIKMMHTHLATSGSARQRFEREGRAAAAVINDAVLPIYAVAEWRGVPYLVMQYVAGMNLQKRLEAEGPLDLCEILRIAIQTARGLAAAHSQGLVHRDVKPSNILLDGSVDRALLTDFGLARTVDDASVTRTGLIAGTPQYMSPEQVRGERVDARSDLFSLGATMYAMCTGHSPFRAESTYSVLHRLTHDEPRDIQEVNSAIPAWFCHVVTKLMAKNPDQRYASAGEVADQLEACLAHVQQPTTHALPKELITKPVPFFDRVMQTAQGISKMKTTKVVAVLLAILCVALIYVVIEQNQREKTMFSILQAERQLFEAVMREHSSSNTNGEATPLKPQAETEKKSEASQGSVTTTTVPASVVNFNSKILLHGVWLPKKIVSSGEVIPSEKRPTEVIFKQKKMIWNYGANSDRQVVFSYEVDLSGTPSKVTFRSEDPKRAEPVLALVDISGDQLRLFSKRNPQGQPSNEWPDTIGTGEEPGTDLMILDVKSFAVGELQYYPVKKLIVQNLPDSDKANADKEPLQKELREKVNAAADSLIELIETNFGPCNSIEFDPASMLLAIDHTEEAHEIIQRFLHQMETKIPLSKGFATPEQAAMAMVKAIVKRDTFQFCQARLLGVCEDEHVWVNRYTSAIHGTKFGNGELNNSVLDMKVQLDEETTKVINVTKVDVSQILMVSTYFADEFKRVDVSVLSSDDAEFQTSLIVGKVNGRWYACPRRAKEDLFYALIDKPEQAKSTE